MKSILTLIFVFLTFFQSKPISHIDSDIKIKILQSIFTNCKLIEIEGTEVVETKARNKFATIPVENNECQLLKLENNIVVLAFNIYLSDDATHYKKMIKAGLYNFMDLDEDSGLQILTKNERLIQLVYFNLDKNKFIGKAENFPVEGLDWLPTGIGDMTQIIEIASLKSINKAKNSCYLTLTECPDCNNSTYYFKYFNGKILASRKYEGCYKSIIESGRKIMGKEVINCYEYMNENEVPKYEIVTLLKW